MGEPEQNPMAWLDRAAGVPDVLRRKSRRSWTPRVSYRGALVLGEGPLWCCTGTDALCVAVEAEDDPPPLVTRAAGHALHPATVELELPRYLADNSMGPGKEVDLAGLLRLTPTHDRGIDRVRRLVRILVPGSSPQSRWEPHIGHGPARYEAGHVDALYLRVLHAFDPGVPVRAAWLNGPRAFVAAGTIRGARARLVVMGCNSPGGHLTPHRAAVAGEILVAFRV